MRQPDETIEIRTSAGIADVPAAEWNRAASGRDRDEDAAASSPISLPATEPASPDPFLAHAFFAALEGSGSAAIETGWQPLHLTARASDGRLLGLAPLYAKGHSQGEYVFDHSWADAWRRAGGRYYPKLQVSVPFTPVTGPRLLVPDGPAEARRAAKRALVDGLAKLTRSAGLSSAHATFLEDDDAQAFSGAGWAIRHDRQFHFPNRGYRDYDDFLDTLLGRKRKQLVRERREAQSHGLDIVALTGAAIEEAHWDAFFAFYQHTGARKWGRPYLNRDFFARVGATMADRCLMILALDHGRPVAGALNFIGRDALYGRWWGALEDYPFLHFEVCYHRAIDWAIEHGLARVEAGAQGEHKIARGYLPSTTRSAHFIADPGFRAAIDRFLTEEKAHAAEWDAEFRATSPYADRERMTLAGFQPT